MRTLGLAELVIGLLPALIVLAIVIIVIYAFRRKPAKTADDRSPAMDREDSQPGSGAAAASGIAPAAESPLSRRNGLATASLALGITVIPAHFLLGLNWSGFLGLVAVVTGMIALLQISRRGGKGKWAAVAGIVLGTLPFILTVGGLLLLTSGPAAG
jgi:hypothetical protein